MTHENLDYVQILRSHGFRVTSQRLIVLDAVCEIDGHASLGEIQARVKRMDPSIDLSTVYRALDVLCQVGLVVVSDLGEGGRVYRIAASSGHHHLLCESCGAVLTIPEQTLIELARSIDEQYGFELRTDHLALPGRCRDCRPP